MQKLKQTLIATALIAQPLLAQNWYEKMDVGPAWMNTFGDYYNGQKRIGAIKGLSIDLGDGWRALFDTETLRLANVYKGGLEWGGTPWTGQHESYVTLANQESVLVTDLTSGWEDESGSLEDNRKIKGHGDMPNGKFTGHYRYDRTVVLEYTINETPVLETLEKKGEDVTRSFQFGKRANPLVFVVADEKTAFTVGSNGASAKSESGLDVIASPGIKLAADLKNPNRLLGQVAKGEAVAIGQIAFGKNGKPTPSAKPDFKKLTAGGPGIWKDVINTEGRISTDKAQAYVTDLVTLPESNPWSANVRFGGFDFIDDDSAALSSWNGDVWVVKGLKGDWRQLKWQRMASGLFETLGLKVQKGEIYVNGRDQITKLIDLNGDGETDYYKVFNRDVYITQNFHEFAFDLQTDKEGNFYFSKGSPVRGGGRGFEKILPHHGIVAKISPDGKKFEVVATGLRAPGGLSIGPNGEITTGENEGSWQPCTKVNFVTAKDAPVFFGTEDSRQSLTSAAFSEPLVYMPMDVDNSGGSQVWVPATAKFGLKNGELIHLSYGQSSLYRVLPVMHQGRRQGGVVKLPISLQSSAMRARFHPDGSLYVLGFRGWQTNAASEAAFQRIRFNESVGLNLPEKLEYTSKGVKVTFPVKLDEELANDPKSYSAQRWDYVRGPQYGSGEFSVDNVDKPARDTALTAESQSHRQRDTVVVESARLSEDGMTVELEFAGMKPSMSLKVSYDLEDAEGGILKSDIHATVYGK
ncbi:MAG: hypothetical protein H7Y36_03735 [Armatimonadetes bacterium]|nr:hypothetical protein [Akkermansiaceae bacterium]